MVKSETPKNSPPKNVAAPPRKSSLIKDTKSPPKDVSKSTSPPKVSTPETQKNSPPKDVSSVSDKISSFNNDIAKQVQKNDVTSPPFKREVSTVTLKKVASPPSNREINSSQAKNVISSLPTKVITSPPPNKTVTSPPLNKTVTSPPPNKVITSPPPNKVITSPPPNKVITSPPPNKTVTSPPPNKTITSPPIASFKFNKMETKREDTFTKINRTVLAKEAPIKTEKLSLTMSTEISDKVIDNELPPPPLSNTVEEGENEKTAKTGESNGVGDKIRKFEKAAEDASANVGRLSRPGSVRGRARTDRLGSDSKEDLPPPATPFKDHVFFDLGNTDKNGSESHITNNTEPILERQQSFTKGLVNSATAKWQRNDSSSIDEKIQKPEPQKIIKPEFKPMPSPVDVTIRSPSLGAKLPDQFPSHGTAFRNVASPDSARTNANKVNDDVNTQNNFKTCKFKNKEKYSVSKGSSYFTRGSEEIWLVKKKDIEEIEERVLDSFRRAGGNLCMRSESMRPSSDSGQSAAFTHATMGRTKRQMYARSESLDPQWAGARAQTLKRQSSVACTCGHDKKTRAKSTSVEAAPRPRSRSHGDENNQGHVLDKYETLV